eukprot:1066224-Pleurochrysis_carterae.AAC.1
MSRTDAHLPFNASSSMCRTCAHKRGKSKAEPENATVCYSEHDLHQSERVCNVPYTEKSGRVPRCPQIQQAPALDTECHVIKNSAQVASHRALGD